MSNRILAIEEIEDTSQQIFWQRQIVGDCSQRSRYFHRKYLFDVIVGWAILVLVSPLICLLWLLVKLTSKGPGFYKQRRVGLYQKEFYVVKLRSMRVDAESDGKAQWCSGSQDDRMTLVGRFLRATHLDELPQLFNVVCGEMSLIGPRPERPEICKKLAEKIEGYYDRVTVKPGITGLSQINLPADQCLEDTQRKQVVDLHYILEANFSLDARICIATAMRMFGIKGLRISRMLGLCRLDFLDEMRRTFTSAPVPKKRVVRQPKRRSKKPRASKTLAALSDSNLEFDLDATDSWDSSSSSPRISPR